MNEEDQRNEQFESYYAAYQPMVLQLCLGYMKGDAERARDLSQEVFLNTWNALPRFRGEASPKTWIYRITVNTCLLHIRSDQKRMTVPLEEERLEARAAPETPTDPAAALYRAIGELPPLERLIMMLVLEELEYEEIERIVGLSAGNLRVRIHRIRKKMKTLLTQGGIYG